MLSSISEFSRSEGHDSMAALAIFSHGKDGLIYGHDGNSNCSVQEVVNHFNSGITACIPKVVESLSLFLFQYFKILAMNSDVFLQIEIN